MLEVPNYIEKSTDDFVVKCNKNHRKNPWNAEKTELLNELTVRSYLDD